MNGEVIDEEYEQNAGDVIENRLTWTGITRKDLNSVFTCQATNTKLTDPQETSVILDLRREWNFKCINSYAVEFSKASNFLFFFYLFFFRILMDKIFALYFCSNIVRPLTIEMFSTDTPLMADRRYDITCVSTGSRPPAIITWYKGNKQLRRVKVRHRPSQLIKRVCRGYRGIVGRPHLMV